MKEFVVKHWASPSSLEELLNPEEISTPAGLEHYEVYQILPNVVVFRLKKSGDSPLEELESKKADPYPSSIPVDELTIGTIYKHTGTPARVAVYAGKLAFYEVVEVYGEKRLALKAYNGQFWPERVVDFGPPAGVPITQYINRYEDGKLAEYGPNTELIEYLERIHRVVSEG